MKYPIQLPQKRFNGGGEKSGILLALVFGAVTLFNAYYNVRNAGKLDVLIREINDK